jgi:hypothetical protein
MDPTIALANMLALAKRIQAAVDSAPDSPLASDADSLASLAIELDAWIRRGGFLPAQWKAAPAAGWTGNRDPSDSFND